jgi:hypothetical protein
MMMLRNMLMLVVFVVMAITPKTGNAYPATCEPTNPGVYFLWAYSEKPDFVQNIDVQFGCLSGVALTPANYGWVFVTPSLNVNCSIITIVTNRKETFTHHDISGCFNIALPTVINSG